MQNINRDNVSFKPNHYAKCTIPSTIIIESKINFTPKITIAIPTYKRVDALKEAIESALNQINFSEYDVIIVDNNPERDCDVEKLILSLGDHRISYYKNNINIGMYNNWNRCITLAKGKYITILNDDDTLNQNYLSAAYENLKKEPKMEAFLCDFQYINHESKIIGNKKKHSSKIIKINPLDFMRGNINPGSLGILFRRKSLLEIGGYDESFYPSADYIFLLNFTKKFKKVFRSSQVLTNYRLAYNESKNIDTLEGFIKKDRMIRNQLYFIYPYLAFLYKNALPLIELQQYESLSGVSNEFAVKHKNRISQLKKSITIKNRYSLKLLEIIRRIMHLFLT